MPSGSSSKPHSSSSKHHSSSSSSKHHPSSSRHSSKSDDWAEVTEPEERRRIQNRIAQRKFREKAREHKERQEREARNQEYAGSSYTVPNGSDLLGGGSDQLSGLPWGGLNIPHMVAHGHNSASQQGGSGQGGISDPYDPHQQQQQYYDFGTSGSFESGGAATFDYDLVDDRGQWQQFGDEILESDGGGDASASGSINEDFGEAAASSSHKRKGKARRS